MRSKIALCALTLAAGLVINNCGKKPDIEVHLPVVEPALTSEASTRAYMAIQNNSTEVKRLVSVQTPRAERGELYTVPISSASADQVEPLKLEAVRIPAMGRTELTPDGDHIQLSGLNADLKVGDTVTLTLNFQDGTQKTVQAKVQTGVEQLEPSES